MIGSLFSIFPGRRRTERDSLSRGARRLGPRSGVGCYQGARACAEASAHEQIRTRLAGGHPGFSVPVAADRALDAVFSTIGEALASGERVIIPGFGTFATKARGARVAHRRLRDAGAGRETRAQDVR